MITIPIWLFALILFCSISISTFFGFVLYCILKIGGESDGKE